MERVLIEIGAGESVQAWFGRQGDKLAVWHHGTPNITPLSPAMLEVFASHGYSVLCPVRRGYLGSNAVGPAPVADDARITAKLVKQVGWDNFVSLGLSGGGPRALADAALNPATTAAILFASLAPADQDFDFFAGLGEEDVEGMKRLQSAGVAMLPMFEEWAMGMQNNPETPTPDANDPWSVEWFGSQDGQFRLSQPAGLPFETGASGWLFDEISFVSPWGFDPAEITKPVIIFHAEGDANVPFSHGQWLQSKIVGSALHALPGRAHGSAFNIHTVERGLAALV